MIVTVRGEDVFEQCLLASVKDELSRIELITVRESKSQANSLNMGIEAARANLIVCPHADVFFKEGWLQRLQKIVETAPESWGVLGAAGTAFGGTMYGTHSGLGMVEGHQHETVQTLDGSLLILRKSSGLRFDEGLDRFHMYDIDVCLQAWERGLKVFVINLPIEHRTKWTAGGGFGEGVEYVKRKWKARVPVIYSTVGTF